MNDGMIDFGSMLTNSVDTLIKMLRENRLFIRGGYRPFHYYEKGIGADDVKRKIKKLKVFFFEE